MSNLYTGRAGPKATPPIPQHNHNNPTSSTLIQPDHVDHTTCLHDFIALEDGAVGCTICYWVWEVEEPLE
jgi:hypothetical protein